MGSYGRRALVAVCVAAIALVAVPTAANAVDFAATLTPAGQPQVERGSKPQPAADLLVNSSAPLPASTRYELTLEDSREASCPSAAGAIGFAAAPTVTLTDSGGDTSTPLVTLRSSAGCAPLEVPDRIEFSLGSMAERIDVTNILYDVGNGVPAGPIAVKLAAYCDDCYPEFDTFTVVCADDGCSNAIVAGRAELVPVDLALPAGGDAESQPFDVTIENVGDAASLPTTMTLRAPWDTASVEVPAIEPQETYVATFTLAAPDDVRGLPVDLTVLPGPQGTAKVFPVVIPKITGPTTTSSSTTTTTSTPGEDEGVVIIPTPRDPSYPLVPIVVGVHVLLVLAASIALWRQAARKRVAQSAPPRASSPAYLSVDWGRRSSRFVPRSLLATMSVSIDPLRRTFEWKKGPS